MALLRKAIISSGVSRRFMMLEHITETRTAGSLNFFESMSQVRNADEAWLVKLPFIFDSYDKYYFRTLEEAEKLFNKHFSQNDCRYTEDSPYQQPPEDDTVEESTPSNDISSLEEKVLAIPGEDGFWKSYVGDVYIDAAKSMVEQGFGEDEAVSMLNQLYSGAADCFGGG